MKGIAKRVGSVLKEKVVSKDTNKWYVLISVILALLSLSYYRETVILEVGVLFLLIGLFVENNGTKNKIWTYSDSAYMVFGRIPIGILMQYFFAGMVAAAFYFFRMQTFTMFLI